MTGPVNTRPYVSNDPGRPATRDIGRIGTIARAVFGVGSLAAAATLGTPSIWHWIVGFGVLPLVSVAVMALLRHTGARPVRWTGPAGHLTNTALAVALFVVMPHAALIFYGAALLLAAARGYAGCEVLAFSNHLLRRSDEIGCPVFSPIDAIERHTATR